MGIADAEWGGSVIWPDARRMRRAFRLMELVRRYSGGDIQVGRKLGGLLARAGLEEVVVSAAAGCDGDRMATERTGETTAAYYDSAEMRRFLPALGLASEDEIDEAVAAWREWGKTPGAMWTRYWCQAVGKKGTGTAMAAS
jgi:hypothetical protein